MADGEGEDRTAEPSRVTDPLPTSEFAGVSVVNLKLTPFWPELPGGSAVLLQVHHLPEIQI